MFLSEIGFNGGNGGGRCWAFGGCGAPQNSQAPQGREGGWISLEREAIGTKNGGGSEFEMLIMLRFRQQVEHEAKSVKWNPSLPPIMKIEEFRNRALDNYQVVRAGALPVPARLFVRLAGRSS